jgi:DNA-binding transcriptional LysR family regulator
MSFGVSHIAPLLPAFLERFPNVKVDLVLNDRLVDLVDEGFDLAVRIGNLRDSSLIARRLCATRLVVCAAPSYLAAHGAPRQPADLKSHRCLGYSYSALGDEWRFHVPDGAHLSIPIVDQIACNNGDALRRMALGGAGIVLQPSFIVADDLASGALVELLGEYQGTELGIHVVYPGSRHVVPKVRAFVDHLDAARFARGDQRGSSNRPRGHGYRPHATPSCRGPDATPRGSARRDPDCDRFPACARVPRCAPCRSGAVSPG